MPGQLFTQYFLSEGIRTTSEWEVRWTPIVDRTGVEIGSTSTEMFHFLPGSLARCAPPV